MVMIVTEIMSRKLVAHQSPLEAVVCNRVLEDIKINEKLHLDACVRGCQQGLAFL